MSRELDFERPILELERQIEELRRIAAGRDRLASVVAPADELDDELASGSGSDTSALEREIERLETESRRLLDEVFGSLSRWQIVQLSRHAERPYTRDYLAGLFTEFTELHGDRCFGDDGAIVGGLARFNGIPVVVLGHQKGRSTKQNMACNFGMARPEGYRKSMRLMRMAERFQLPIVTFIDTPGAFPGIDAEERGQAQAIAESLETMAALTVPMVAVVIGEGGSGGALAIGVANRVLMLEYATYSVISPEACSSILFKDPGHAERAADALKLTARDLLDLGVVDRVVDEPEGGAHRDPAEMMRRLGTELRKQLQVLRGMGPEDLVEDRYTRFRRLGAFVDLAKTKGDGA